MNKRIKNFGFLAFVLTFVFYLSDFREVSYDSEPDYIANGLAIHENYTPTSSHHPGTLNYYFVSLNLIITKSLNLTPSNTIYYLRAVYFVIFLFILWYSKTNLFVFLFFIVVSELTYLKNVNFIVSAEIILAPLTFLLLYFLKSKTSPIYIAVLFGCMINIKLTAILLMPFVLALNTFDKKTNIKILTISLLVFVGLSVPTYNNIYQAIRPFHNILLQSTIIESVEGLIGYDIKINKFWTFALLAMSVIFTLLLYLVFNKNFEKFRDIKFLNILMFLSAISLIMLHNSENIRHISLLLPVLLVQYQDTIFKPKLLKPIILCFFLFLVYGRISKTIDFKTNPIDEYIIQSKSKVYLYQESKFNSEVEFLKWANYRYGNSEITIPDYWSKTYYKTEYLNTRFFLAYEEKQRETVIKNYKTLLDKNSTNSYTKDIIYQFREMLNQNQVILISTKQKQSFILEHDLIRKKLKHNFHLKQIESNNIYTTFTVLEEKNL